MCETHRHLWWNTVDLKAIPDQTKNHQPHLQITHISLDNEWVCMWKTVKNWQEEIIKVMLPPWYKIVPIN